MDKNDVVIIKLDRPRMLWFGHKALKALGALTGKSLDKLDFNEDTDLGEIEKMMYCGLLTDAKNHNETLKLEDMEDLLDLVPFGDVVKAMEKALSASFGNFDNGKNLKRVAVKSQK
jgi:hypothetical protein